MQQPGSGGIHGQDPTVERTGGVHGLDGFPGDLQQQVEEKALDAALEKAVAGKRVAGAVFLVAKDGKLIYHAAAGSLDCEGKTPMREDALFRYSSVSKLFTTMAAAAPL